MNSYDPAQAPTPEVWLSRDEQERIRLVEAFHRAERIKLPNTAAHAVFHVVIENQIAEGLDSVVRAMARLETQGLSRHDCLHAIAWVFAHHFYDALHAGEKDGQTMTHERYDAAVERLDAATWRVQTRE